ncbi:MAG TPA: hypothetical protein VGH33_23260 [Isosphaeraceae bacterium]
MATALEPGFYREELGEAGILYVDGAGTLWLVHTGDDADLPLRLDDEQAVGLEPFPDISPEDAAEYRRMVQDARGGAAEHLATTASLALGTPPPWPREKA